MYILGLIPRNFVELAEAVPIEIALERTAVEAIREEWCKMFTRQAFALDSTDVRNRFKGIVLMLCFN